MKHGFPEAAQAVADHGRYDPEAPSLFIIYHMPTVEKRKKYRNGGAHILPNINCLFNESKLW